MYFSPNERTSLRNLSNKIVLFSFFLKKNSCLVSQCQIATRPRSTILFQEKHKWLKSAALKVYRAHSNSPSSATATFYEIDNLETSAWNFENIHLNITKSKSKSSMVSVTSTSKTGNILVHIYNSTFGSLQLFGKHQVILSQSNFHFTDKHEESLLEAVNSKLQIHHCIFAGNGNSSPSVVLKALHSHIEMSNVVISGFQTVTGLIQLNTSKIHLEKVSIVQNGNKLSGSAITLVKSKANTTNCQFERNIGNSGSCIRVQEGSSLIVQNSTFKHNVAMFCGGAIYCEADTYLTLNSTHFVNNSAWYIADDIQHSCHAFPGGGAIRGEDGVTVTAHDSSFVNNSCKHFASSQSKPAQSVEDFLGIARMVHDHELHLCLGGAIRLGSSASVYMRNVTHEKNTAQFGGAVLSVANNSSVLMDTCVFRKNKGDTNHSISTNNVIMASGDSTHLRATHCQFVENLGVINIGFWRGQARISADNCSFENNFGQEVISCVYDYITKEQWEQLTPRKQRCIITTRNCSFSNNTANVVIQISSGFLQSTNCRFNDNRGVFQLMQNSNVSIVENFLLKNTQHHNAVVDCAGCAQVDIQSSLFIFHDPNIAVFKFNFAKLVKISNCTFLDNRPAVFYAHSDLILDIVSCTFNYTMAVGDKKYDLVDISGNSQITIVDTQFDTDVSLSGMITTWITDRTNLTISNSTFNGYITFRIYFNSNLTLTNCFLTGPAVLVQSSSLLTEGQIILKDSSSLRMIETKVYWDPMLLICSESKSTVNVINCTLDARSQTTQVMLSDGCLNIDRTTILWTPRDKLSYYLPKDKRHSPHLIEAYSSEVHVAQSTINVTIFSSMFWLKLVSSNASLISSILESSILTFVDVARNYLVVENSAFLSGGIWIMYGARDILVKNSSTHMTFTSNCNKHVGTLRLANSHVHIYDEFPDTSRTLTWKAVVYIGNSSYNTSANFVTKAKHRGLLENTKCNRTDRKIISESKFATGKNFSFQYFHKHEAARTLVFSAWNFYQKFVCAQQLQAQQKCHLHSTFVFFSAFDPVVCGKCICQLDIRKSTNIFNCTRTNSKTIPAPPAQTEHYLLDETNITMVTDRDIKNLRAIGTLRIMNLTNNKIRTIAPGIQNLDTVEEIWLSGNPLDCDCGMIWMIHWLNNFTKKSIVRDYKDITCGSGRLNGIPVHGLSEVTMGCYPHKWTTGQKAGIGTAVHLLAIVFVAAVIVTKKSSEVKFLMYYYLHLNTVPKDDKTEDLDKKYDAFFCYRYVMLCPHICID